MKQVKALVLRAAGINCDVETEYALELAGARADRIHINKIITEKEIIDNYQIMVFPGGFSYGDDVAAGKILSNQIIHHLADKIREFISAGKLILGICNGFQVLVKTGILPGFENTSENARTVTITDNNSGKFEDRWVYLKVHNPNCVFLKDLDKLYLPVAHAEGKVVVSNENVLEKLENGHIGLKYVNKNGQFGDYPINPNGSVNSIAALTDKTGRVFGLMPHPERFVDYTQHPNWTRNKDKTQADGLRIFTNAVKYIKNQIL
jgi:phosphoribosylformylglycinamidine synthase